MTYTADVYLSEQQLCKNAVIKDHGVPGQLFFYDNDRVGHFIIGDITIKNSTDTTFVKWKHLMIWRKEITYIN